MEFSELLIHPFLETLNEGYVKQISAFAQRRIFASGEFIFRQGKKADHFYLIESGKAGVELFSGQQGPVTIETLSAGDVLGWSWLIPPYLCTFDVRALQQTETIALDAQALRDLMEKNRYLGYEILKRFTIVIAERLEAERSQLVALYAAHSA